MTGLRPRAAEARERRPARLASDITLALLISQLGFAAAFAANIMAGRLLGPDGKGSLSLFMVSVFAVSTFASLGIGHGQMYHASRNPDRVKHFLPNAAVLSVLLGGGAAMLYFLLGSRANLRTVSLLTGPTAVLAVATTPVLLMLTFQRQYLLTVRAYRLSKLLAALAQVFPFLFYVLLYAAGRISVRTMIWAFAASQIICFALFFAVAPNSRPVWRNVSARFARSSFSFGLRQYSSDVVLYLTSRMDFFLVAAFLGPAALGLYSISVSFAEIATRTTGELGTILFPAFASGQIPRERVPLILKFTFLVALAGAGLLALVCKPLILTLLGHQFRDSVVIFYALLPGVVAWSTIYVTWNRVSAGGRPGLGLPVFGAAAAVDAGLNVLLLPRLGVLGAGIAATVSYWVAASLFLWLFCRLEGFSARDVLFLNSGEVRDIRGAVRTGLGGLRRALRRSSA